MGDQAPDRKRWYLHVRRPKCPACGSVKLLTYKSLRHIGGLTRYSKCQTCHVRIIVTVD